MSTPKVAIIIQGRIGSTRVPRKLFADICGKTALEQLYRRCRAVKASGCDCVVMAAVPTQDAYEVFERTGIMAVGGPEKDLLTRILNTARQVEADLVVRVTADNVLSCPTMIKRLIEVHRQFGLPVTQNWKPRTYPNGVDLEVFDVKYLEYLDGELKDEDDREYFASWAVDHLPQDAQGHLVNEGQNLSWLRLTVDWPEDLELARTIYGAMGNEIWDLGEILNYLSTRPQLVAINQKYNTSFGARPK